MLARLLDEGAWAGLLIGSSEAPRKQTWIRVSCVLKPGPELWVELPWRVNRILTAQAYGTLRCEVQFGHRVAFTGTDETQNGHSLVAGTLAAD